MWECSLFVAFSRAASMRAEMTWHASEAVPLEMVSHLLSAAAIEIPPALPYSGASVDTKKKSSVWGLVNHPGQKTAGSRVVQEVAVG